MTNPPPYNPWSVIAQPSAPAIPAPFVPTSLTINNNTTNNPQRETNTTNNYQKWVKYLLIISLSILLITIASAIIYILSNGNFVFSSEISAPVLVPAPTTTSSPTTTPAPTTAPTTTAAPTTTPAPTPAPPPYYISSGSSCQYKIQTVEECSTAAYNYPIWWRSSSSNPRAYDQSLSSAPTGCYIDCRNPQSSMCRNRYSGVYFKSSGTDAGCSSRYPCICTRIPPETSTPVASPPPPPVSTSPAPFGCHLSFQYRDQSGGENCAYWGGSITISCGNYRRHLGPRPCSEMGSSASCPQGSSMLIQWNIQESDIGFTMRNCLMGTDTLDIDRLGSGERTIVCRPAATALACSSSSLKLSFILILFSLLNIVM